MNFLDETAGVTSSGGKEKKVSSTLELAKKLGLLQESSKPTIDISLQNNNKIDTSSDFSPNENKNNQDLIDFLLEDSAKTAEQTIEEIEVIKPKSAKEPTKQEQSNSDDSSFISINVDNEIMKKQDKSKSNNSQSLTLLEDDKNKELVDFLLDSEDDSDSLPDDMDLSIDDVDEVKILDTKPDTKVEDELVDLDEKLEDEILAISCEDTPSKDDINSGLLVTAKDIENYFASLESKKEKKTYKHKEEEDIISKAEEFDISKNIVDNSPKTVSKGGGVLTFQSFEFKGKALEYFKIWIVNIALTILTLGVYSAWAKVRNLRYIYGNTYLNNSNFEFNADPKRILYGRLIVFGFYAIFLLASDILYNQTLALSVAGVFILLLPWLIKQAIRFKLKSASYRNIRFKFHGKARSFYFLAIGSILAFIAVFTPLIVAKYSNYITKDLAMNIYLALFFIYTIVGIPIIYKKFKDIIINNSSYGNEMFSFHATKKGAVSTFLQIGFTTAVAGFVFGLLIVIPTKFLGLSAGNLESFKDIKSIIAAAIGIILYLSFIGLYKGITDGHLSNFIRNNTKLGDGEFKTSIYPYKLGIISMTNTLAVVLSLGLLYPWAKMRYLKYKIENTQFACKNYSKFEATDSKDVSTIGEEATDFFDIDIGV